MCLAVPAKLLTCVNGEGVVDLHGSQIQVSTVLVPEAGIGDWVLVHAGFAIQRLDEDEAAETFALLADMERAQAETHHEDAKARKETRGAG